MPSKFVVRQYTEPGYYHVYNRGVEKRKLFLDEQDYKMFLYYCFVYLAPRAVVLKRYPTLKYNLKRNNLHDHVALLAFCLMPNHFHFLLRQDQPSGITKLLRQLTNGYTRYFNSKYDRVGSLVQGPFKAKPVETDEYLLYLTSYIHRNALELPGTDTLHLTDYIWSSYRMYSGIQPSLYVDTTPVLSFFSKSNDVLSYKNFVESAKPENVLPEEYLIDWTKV